MQFAVNRFSDHVSSFDKTVFLTRDVVNIVTWHFRDIRYADRRYSIFSPYFDSDNARFSSRRNFFRKFLIQ